MERVMKVLLLAALAAIAEQQACGQSRLPADSWEQLPQGFAIALTYDKNYVTLNLRNTSDTGREIRRSSINILLFYIDAHGALVPLSNNNDRKKHGDPAQGILDDIDPPDSRGPMGFPPRMGAWYQLGVEITPEDRLLIKEHPVVCRVEFYDLANNAKIHLESAPKMIPSS